MKSKNYKSNHALEILSMLNDDRIKMKNYCDVTLIAGSNDFAGHKCILGVFSSFFSKMFSVEMREKYERKGNVPGVTEETLEAVLSFIYTCNITITSENVYNVIEAANYMDIPNLKEFCVEFLLEEIDATNCLHIRSYSKLYNLDKLLTKANFVIVNNFESLIKENEFNNLKFQDVKEIFQMENKNVTSEEIVFHGMIQWIKHDVDARKEHLTELFNLLNLENVSSDFLRHIVSQEELIMNSSECLKICFKETLSRIPVQTSNQPIVGQLKSEGHFIAVVGKQLSKYDVTKKETTKLPNTLFDHSQGSFVSHKRNMYVICGHDTNSMERLDLDDLASGWNELASTNAKTSGAASVVFDNCIYTCGSMSGKCYNFGENRWYRIDDMNEARTNFAMVSTSGGIYAIGGFSDGCFLDSVEHHDPRQGGWNIVPPMKVARSGLAGAALNGQLYAIGGENCINGNLNSVERFDPRSQTWCNVPDLNYPRSYHGACVLNGKIYVAGGGSDAVEVYYPERNIWEIEANIPESKNVQFIVDI